MRASFLTFLVSLAAGCGSLPKVNKVDTKSKVIESAATKQFKRGQSLFVAKKYAKARALLKAVLGRGLSGAPAEWTYVYLAQMTKYKDGGHRADALLTLYEKTKTPAVRPSVRVLALVAAVQAKRCITAKKLAVPLTKRGTSSSISPTVGANPMMPRC